MSVGMCADIAIHDKKNGNPHAHIMLRPKAWKAEVADLTAQKDRLYQEMRKLKEEVAEAETVKRCIEQAIPLTEQGKEKPKTHDVSL